MVVRYEQIDSLSEYVNFIENLEIIQDEWLFRGQPVKGNLLPKIARINPNLDSTPTEKTMLEEMRRTGSALIAGYDQSDWDLLVAAQHHGLAKRLLDWTSNPMAALWFACSSASKENDGYVYILNPTDKIISANDRANPFKPSSTKVFQPKLNNPRIVSQHGWFTVHNYISNQGKFIRLETNKVFTSYIKGIHIEPAFRASILQSLDRLGVNSRSLFPDFEGMCNYLNWKHNSIRELDRL